MPKSKLQNTNETKQTTQTTLHATNFTKQIVLIKTA